MSVLQQAKEIAEKGAKDQKLWINLWLMEQMIAEIEALQHRVEVLSESHLKPVRERAEKRQQEG